MIPVFGSEIPVSLIEKKVLIQPDITVSTEIGEELISDLAMSFDTDQIGSVLLDIETGQRMRFPQLDIDIEKSDLLDVMLREKVVKGDGGHFDLFCFPAYYEFRSGGRFRQVAGVADDIELRFFIRFVGDEEVIERGPRAMLPIALTEFAVGVNGDALPIEVFFEIISVASVPIMISADIQEESVPAVFEKMTDDDLLVPLRKVLGGILFKSCS